jgi:hypothetical protein
MSLKPFSGNVSFNAQHSPMGAFMSFTCGHFHARGGIGVQIGKPANQDLYIGVKDGDRFSDAPLKCLPFYKPAAGVSGAADFQVEQAGPSEQKAAANVISYGKDQIQRRYGWATDEWKTPDFTFAVYTPFGTIPEPGQATHRELAEALRPAVIAELTIDNSAGTTTKTAFFAINFNEPGWRPLAIPNVGPRRGFALRREIGLIAEVADHSDECPTLFCRWTPDEGLRQPTPHLLGSCPGVFIEVGPGEKRTLRLALGCHLPNIVTTGLEGRYLYNRCFTSLEHVLNDALDAGDTTPRANQLDEELTSSGLSDDQQFLIAHATRSYYGSTQLLDVGGEPFWIVNEGEYCMMNTLDLSVDQVFWELKHNPWVVRNLLDNFVRHYSYVDQVKVRSGPLAPVPGGEGQGEGVVARGSQGAPTSQATSPSPQPSPPTTGERESYTLAPGGISFCHDMGAHNNFSPPGHSSYELPDLTGCFSYMTAEQLCNWILIATTYAVHTSDMEWAIQNQHVIDACAISLVNRGPSAGIIEFDADRCGGGSEITTYDSLDHSLAQTRHNLYIAVKVWAAYQGLARFYEVIREHHEYYDMAQDMAARVEKSVARKLADAGFIPAIFEAANPGAISRILPAIEGLLYPLVWNETLKRYGSAYLEDDRLVPRPLAGTLIDVLLKHTLTLLLDPQHRNLFPDGGLKLSSTSNNSWMSKIALFQHVAREVFQLDDDPIIKDLFAKADAAHVKWQTDGSGYWACSDQFVNGIAKGSRYYPRIITAALWLDGRGAAALKRGGETK